VRASPETTVATVRRLRGSTLSSRDEELLALLLAAYPTAACQNN
jgi:hypothetical protein